MTVDLSHLEGEFESADESKARNFDTLPDGKYFVEVEAAEVKTSKAGQPMLSWTLRVLQGRYDNRMLWRNNMLETKQNLGWLKKDLKICGVELAKLNDLNTRASELVGLCLEITQKTSDKYSNVYLNRLLTDEEIAKLSAADPAPAASGGNGATAPARAATEADDVIPF
jgi:hypothetical protein